VGLPLAGDRHTRPRWTKIIETVCGLMGMCLAGDRRTRLNWTEIIETVCGFVGLPPGPRPACTATPDEIIETVCGFMGLQHKKTKTAVTRQHRDDGSVNAAGAAEIDALHGKQQRYDEDHGNYCG